MKKDYFWFTVIGLLIFGYVLDRISGPISLGIKNPYLFLKTTTLMTYPFTAVSIAAKAIALAGIALIGMSYFPKAYFVKATLLFFIAALGQLYTIQQLATNGKVTPIEWTLAIAYTGVILLPIILIHVLQGMFSSAHKAIVKEIQPIRHDLPRPQAGLKNPPTTIIN